VARRASGAGAVVTSDIALDAKRNVASEAHIFGLEERFDSELAVGAATFAGIEENLRDMIEQLFDRRSHGQEIFRNG